MIQGTGSDVGKSLIVAGLCRAFTRRGLEVRPFKPQNMSNNAAVTADGGEIGRAQALQARAVRRAAERAHEPGAAEAAERDRLAGRGAGQGRRQRQGARVPGAEAAADGAPCWRASRDCAAEADLVLVEGAGSAAEVNLRANDIANMGFARAADVPVVLVGDIDRGGVIAQHRRHQGGARSRTTRRWSRASSSTASAAIPACSTTGMRDHRATAPAGRRSAWCRTSPTPHGCRPRTRSALDSARAGAARRTSRSPCRCCRASPISTISIRCGRSPASSSSSCGRASALPGDADAGHPAGLEGDHRRSRGAARGGLGHRHLQAHRAPRRPRARALRRLPDARPRDRRSARASRAARRRRPGSACSTSRPMLTATSGSRRHGREPRRRRAVHGLRDACRRDRRARTRAARAALRRWAASTARSSADGRVRGGYVHGLFADDRQRAAWLRGIGAAASGFAYEADVEATLDALAAHLEAHIDLRPAAQPRALSEHGDQRRPAAELHRAGEPVERRAPADVARRSPRAARRPSGVVHQRAAIDARARERRPSAPAIAASGQPALGERCRAASRQTARQRLRRRGARQRQRPRARSSSAASREAGRLTRSSKRAAAQPKRAWRGVRWPIMLSAVLTAL